VFVAFVGTSKCHLGKDYYISTHFLASWTEAWGICKNYGLDFVSLDTAHEAEEFLKVSTRLALNV